MSVQMAWGKIGPDRPWQKSHEEQRRLLNSSISCRDWGLPVELHIRRESAGRQHRGTPRCVENSEAGWLPKAGLRSAYLLSTPTSCMTLSRSAARWPFGGALTFKNLMRSDAALRRNTRCQPETDCPYIGTGARWHGGRACDGGLQLQR